MNEGDLPNLSPVTDPPEIDQSNNPLSNQSPPDPSLSSVANRDNTKAMELDVGFGETFNRTVSTTLTSSFYDLFAEPDNTFDPNFDWESEENKWLLEGIPDELHAEIIEKSHNEDTARFHTGRFREKIDTSVFLSRTAGWDNTSAQILGSLLSPVDVGLGMVTGGTGNLLLKSRYLSKLSKGIYQHVEP